MSTCQYGAEPPGELGKSCPSFTDLRLRADAHSPSHDHKDVLGLALCAKQPTSSFRSLLPQTCAYELIRTPEREEVAAEQGLWRVWQKRIVIGIVPPR